MEFNLYLALAVNGFFTGIGVIIAHHLDRIWIKRGVNKIIKKIKTKEKERKEGV